MPKFPFLTADDMCHNVFDGPNGSHCLLGHMMALPESIVRTNDWSRASEMLRDAAGGLVGQYNDSHTLQQNADLWNTTFNTVAPT